MIATPRIALDIHTHQIPLPADALDGLPGVSWDEGARCLTLDQTRIGLAPLFSPRTLIAWLDTQGIGQAWVSVPPLAYRQHLPVEAAATWIDALNGALLVLTAAFAPRLRPMLHLPIEHPALAARLAASAIAEGHRLFGAAAGGPGVLLSDPVYEPLWQTLAAPGCFLFLHPQETPDPRVAHFYLRNLFGNPVETGMAAAHLVLSGVPARHPGLIFGLAHAGGVTAGLGGRWQRGLDTARPGIDQLIEPPLAALRRIWVDAIAHHPAALQQAAAIHGTDHVIFGSDWPFPMGLPDPHPQLRGTAPDLLAALCGPNAAALGRYTPG